MSQSNENENITPPPPPSRCRRCNELVSEGRDLCDRCCEFPTHNVQGAIDRYTKILLSDFGSTGTRESPQLGQRLQEAMKEIASIPLLDPEDQGARELLSMLNGKGRR